MLYIYDMSETRLQKKIILICIGIHIGITILVSPILGGFNSNDYLILFGLIGILMGFLLLVVGLLLLFAEDKRFAQGFLLSAGIILLLGFLSCSGSTLKTH